MRKPAQEKRIENTSCVPTIVSSRLNKAVAGSASLRFRKELSKFPFTSTVEGRVDRRLDVRIPQIETFEVAIFEVAAHSFNDSPNTSPRPRDTASESEEVCESSRVLARDGQV